MFPLFGKILVGAALLGLSACVGAGIAKVQCDRNAKKEEARTAKEARIATEELERRRIQRLQPLSYYEKIEVDNIRQHLRSMCEPCYVG